MHQQSKTARAKFHDASPNGECLEGSVESGEAENGGYARATSPLMDMEGVGTVEVNRKGKKIYRKKDRAGNDRSYQLDGGEACSGTEEGLYFNSLKEQVDCEATNSKPDHFSPKGQRKRSKKLFFGGTSIDVFLSFPPLWPGAGWMFGLLYDLIDLFLHLSFM